ncbi:asparagine synthase (glutamine-hydrolyzing) [Chryseobacterium camelliae]|uniref:asparagine synthase (glutamine-hydrolyzing) n=1 Tax=Chryseobacterium camelliae TaxID=1265445 RepID=UPI000C1C9413|nr:asparagine synthase (glutamine-hydrolyzing) [Chryseobacterium camelliae]
MCGIVGIVSRNKNILTYQQIKMMTDAIEHRGPDGDGQWIDETENVGLGHRRLSIIDLSDAGSQPMHYLDRYSIVFNGEIYNYLEIRDFLSTKGYVFRSDSDTEVLMANFDYKKEKCLEDFDGMFAFAIWDKQEQKLFCARDRFGEKPFYYYQNNESFYFGSEMKALWRVDVPRKTNGRMLFNYWHFGYINNSNDLSETFYEDIYQLEPSHYMFIDSNGKIVKKHKYWDIDHRNQLDFVDFREAKETFFRLFETSISRRLRSDVAVGTSLSGGLDSSSTVCMINHMKVNGVEQKTFSARFPNFVKDESVYIDKVLDTVNAKGISCFPTTESMLNNVDKIIHHQEEPFGTLSIAAQYEVMKLARENGVIVLLDGQGADEYLCGYHGLIDSFFIELKSKDKKLYREQLKTYKEVHSSNKINNISRRLRNNFLKEMLSDAQIDKLLGIKSGIDNYIKKDAKKDLYSKYKNEQFDRKYSASSLNEMLYHATFRGGLQELLRYADRNSMAHSLEVRLPFLSHELVEFVFTLPSICKVNNGFSKFILREAMNEIVPKDIVWRKDKIGYEPPNKNDVNGITLKKYLVNSFKM